MKDREELTTGPESGAYTWLKSASKAVVDAITEQPKEDESKSSLYNLLDHSADALWILSSSIRRHLLELSADENRENNPDYKLLKAWHDIVWDAYQQKQKQDSEAWASQTAKEIKETLNQQPL